MSTLPQGTRQDPPTRNTRQPERVEQLAAMTALVSRLREQIPATMHRALLNGVDVEEVAEAAGINTAGVIVEWTQWAVEQRYLYESTPPGMEHLGISATEYERARNAIHGTASSET